MDLSTFSRESQLVWQQDATSQHFQHYLDKSQTLLAEVHGQDLHAELYRPFEWTPPGFWQLPHAKRRGVLLVHGLLDGPSRMADLARTYVNQGYLVRTLLLTGHGLKPQALYNIRKEDWFALVQFGIRQLQQDVGHSILMGHSGGGALCLWHLLTTPPKETTPDDAKGTIQSIIAFAPPLMLKDPFSVLLPLLNLIPRNLIFRTHHGSEVGKYDSFSQHFAFQAHSLARQVRQLLIRRKLPVPAYLVLAAHDETVHSGIAKYELLRDKNPAHRVDWYSPKSPCHQDPRVHWHNSVYPSFKIKDFSHISLCTHANNPYYGTTAYQAACQTLGKHARPCFNPDYDPMVQRLLAFTADTMEYPLS